MRVLVTGGTGFVGRNLLHHLHEQGHDITLLHRPTSRLIDLPEGIRRVTGELTRPETIHDVCKGVDWVFHVAGDVTWGRRLRKRMFANNLEATRNLLAEAERSGVKRFVYTSSAAAVGLPDSEQPADETFPFNGYDLNVGYAIAKRQAEEAVLSRAAEGFPARAPGLSSRLPRRKRTSPRTCHHTRCAIPSQPTYWKVERMSGWCRNCWAMRQLPRRRSTPW